VIDLLILSRGNCESTSWCTLDLVEFENQSYTLAHVVPFEGCRPRFNESDVAFDSVAYGQPSERHVLRDFVVWN
jgi:hypothetical protein